MDIFNKYDQKRDLVRVLGIASNTVKFNLNRLFDTHKEYDIKAIAKIYPLNASLEILSG